MGSRMKLLATFLALLWPLLALAGPYATVQLDDDGKHLVITTTDGRTVVPRKLSGQVGFENAMVSKDGRRVGWLALYPNCCTSYPIPLQLVVLDADKRLHAFKGRMAIFGWCFLGNGDEIAYRQTVLHGSNFLHFERRRIADKKLLAEYDYPDDDEANRRARELAPAWVKSVPE
jgi:hypothetical protein